MKELMQIQTELKAPKNQLNKFGGYKYRSCEDILEAVKPLLKKYECCLLLSDEVLNGGTPILETEIVDVSKEKKPIQVTRTYIEAKATLINKDGNEISSRGIAREASYKTGMDSAQITGATSSYARKYALNGLFCIDDTKDADSTNDHGKGKTSEVKKVQDKLNKLQAPVKAMQIEITEHIKKQAGIKGKVHVETKEKQEIFFELMFQLTGQKDVTKLTEEELKEVVNKIKETK